MTVYGWHVLAGLLAVVCIIYLDALMPSGARARVCSSRFMACDPRSYFPGSRPPRSPGSEHMAPDRTSVRSYTTSGPGLMGGDLRRSS